MITTAIRKLLGFAFGVFTWNKHILYAVLNGNNLKKVEDILRLKKAFDHISQTCDLLQKNNPGSDKIIVDVGGGSGNTLRLFHSKFPNLKVHVFEPIPSNVELIRKKNIPNSEVHACALGNSEEKMVLHITSNITSSSLLKPVDPDKYGSELIEKGELNIEVKRLDSFFPEGKIGILKMDVQGYEMRVLEGAGELLKNTDFIILEVNNHEVYEGSPTYFELDTFLRSNGFILMNLYPGRVLEGKLLDWDAVYKRAKV
jgi:FkbM family methyltransferase